MWAKLGISALSALGLNHIFDSWFGRSTGGSKAELEISLSGIGKAAAGVAAVGAVAVAAVMMARKRKGAR